MPLIKRRLTSGRWVIDNGDKAAVLESCPHCGAPLDEKGADGVLRALADGRLTFSEAIRRANVRRHLPPL